MKHDRSNSGPVLCPPNSHARVFGLWGAAKAYWLAQWMRQGGGGRPVLVVCEGRHEAEEWVAGLKTCLEMRGHEARIFILEGWEIPEHEENPSLECASERSVVIEALLAGTGKASQVIVATLSGALQGLLPRERYAQMRRQMRCGQSCDRDELVQQLVHWGYERTPIVEKKGDFAVHGGIVDVYPVASSNPLRLEFDGDVLESLRYFDAISQRSQEAVQTAVIHAANEWKILGHGGGISITEYLPKNAVMILDEPVELAALDGRMKGQDGLMVMPRMEFPMLLEAGSGCGLPQVALSLLPQSLAGWENAPVVEFESQPVEMALDKDKAVMLQSDGSLGRNARDVMGQLEKWIREGYAGFLVFQNAAEESRLLEWVKEQGLDRPWMKKVRRVQGDMPMGFVSSSFRVVFLTEMDIFGRTKLRRDTRRFHGVSPLSDFLELSVGDYVVHQRHGIGRCLGIGRLSQSERERSFAAEPLRTTDSEYLSIEYADDAKLHVPLDQMYLVQKYIGIGDRPVVLDQLGSKRWETTKARVLAQTLIVARELLDVQAARKSLEGIPYSKDTMWQREFEAAFPYEETPDQVTSIQAVKKDMESAQPMDRLICGDVGYGKTEVAIRAAFKAVMDHRQVAVLVPTTLLAQQHFVTFSQRMADYPVRVEMLSRFRHPAQTRKILLDAVEGKIDILIGTHRLLQRDVQFKDLGLVIVDEEQRFGVKHKESLKKLRRLVDVLTLTATPIPRTLYLSLLGTKEMSAINTPPQDRLPVQTALAEYSEDLIRRAIRFELGREGQVYFVHNRVRTIDKVAKMVQRLVPDATVVAAHGQMQEDLLSDIMSKFVAGQIDVLVTTTIIESGLDIPNANTLIVDRADLFGLAELYQLRGRVGRFKNKAYAYFLLPKDAVLLEAAKKRLKAIHDFTALGSGYKIALRDLEIRGAGNILGHQQHGHIAAVGFDLYCRLLKQNIARLKDMPALLDQEVTVKIGWDLAIPADYVPSEAMRMDLYRRISGALEMAQVDDIEAEVNDRFGKPPSQVQGYLELARVRIAARKKGIFFIERKDGRWHLRKDRDRVTEGGKLPRSDARNAAEALEEIKNVLWKLPDAVRIGAT